jgi:hypothetical protein
MTNGHTPARGNHARNAIVYNPGFPATSPLVNSADTLLSCIRLIKERHESVARSNPARALELAENLTSLRLAEAFLEKGELARRLPDHPLQIAVIGPTQAGKSSVVNLLLGAPLARVSPLAGFTVHPQGFCLNMGQDELPWLDGYFRDYRRCRLDELPSDRYNAYALSDPLTRPGHPLPSCVIWDTPDFDSVDAEDYRTSVLRTAALADAVLLVVSKDKYADQSVWETMRLLEPLGQPVGVCLNKVVANSRDTLVRSLEQKWRDIRGDAPVRIVTLPYMEDWEPEATAPLQAQAGQLLAMLGAEIGNNGRQRHLERTKRLIATHWSAWLAPIRREQNALTEWSGMIESAIREALMIYRRDFLNHPQHYETFQRALAELLTLLEVPGLARTLMTARKVVTWPVRQIAKLGQSLRSRRQDEISQEAAILAQAVEHLLIRIAENVLEKGETDPTLRGWWRELGHVLHNERKSESRRCAAAIARYHQSFQPEIDRTAHQLYDRLREHPAVLNSLRATRITTDAAALAVALHTGGIGIHDFILAPAILSLTSMLAEGALGRYLHKAEAELKQRQYQEVEKLFDSLVRTDLNRLPGKLDPSNKFNIPAQTLEVVEALLK